MTVGRVTLTFVCNWLLSQSLSCLLTREKCDRSSWSVSCYSLDTLYVLHWLPVQGTARAVPQYRWQYRKKVDFALRLFVMFPIYDRTWPLNSMKPESGRTRGSRADPQICLQRGAGSISPRTMMITFFIFFFLLEFLPDKSFFLFLSFFPLVLTTRFLLPLSITLCPSAPNHTNVFPFQIPSLSHR